jgi:hypothetical protein
VSVQLIEVEPGKWRVKRSQKRPPRSALPMPFVISDSMEPTEQVDGKFYTSKRQFRAVGRARGLTEVGTEKLKHKVVRASTSRAAVEGRRTAIRTAVEKYVAAPTHQAAVEMTRAKS